MRRTAAVGLLAVIALSACGPDAPSRAISDPVPLPQASVPDSAPATGGTFPPGLAQPSFMPPAQLAAGRLAGLMGHRGAGEVSIWRQPDGSLIVRLDQFEVSNVGGLAVYLVPGRAAETIEGGARLGPLPTSRGTVNVPIPADVAVRDPRTVLIWSEESRLPVANATATPL